MVMGQVRAMRALSGCAWHRQDLEAEAHFSLAATVVACDACTSAKRRGARAIAAPAIGDAHNSWTLQGIRWPCIPQRIFKWYSLLINNFLCSAGFNYVVNPPVLPKVAFGTTMHRKVMNLKGPFMNGFMKKNLPEPRTYPSPIDYNCSKPIGFKVTINTGVYTVF